MMGFNVDKIRQDFPVLQREINKKPVVYFDNACMSLKPVQVIEAMNRYYNEFPACAGRSYHSFGKQVTEEVDRARKTIKDFIGAKKESQILFSRNATESLNLLSRSLRLNKGDAVLTSDKEHNSNLLPWQLLAKRRGIIYDYFRTTTENQFDEEEFKKKLTKHVKAVSFPHRSNLDGTSLPAEKIVKIVHDHDAIAIVDAAQSAPHEDINAKKLDADFIVCSGHKMLGPTGTGFLYGKEDALESLKPFMLGGDTVKDTTYEGYKLEDLPHRFEAGLQDYAGIIGFWAAAEYLDKVGREDIADYEKELNKRLTEGMLKNNRVELIGPKDSSKRGGIFSFNLQGVDPHEIALLMDQTSNVMIRSGAHCVHSWFNARGLKGSARASMYLYNTADEVDIFLKTFNEVQSFFK